jgi:opacity protein-like surface antigen
MKRLFAALFSLTLLATAVAAAETPAAPAAKPAPRSKAPAAGFTPAPSGWYAEFRGGIATQDVPDLDANIAYWEQIGVQFLDSPGDLHRFSQAPVFALEAGLRHGPWSYGVESQWQRQTVDNFTAGTFSGSLDMSSLFSVLDVRATVSARPASLFGFEAGASAGWAFGHYSERYALSVYSAPQANITVSGAYDASAPSLGAHLGWRRPLYGNTWLLARAAWSWRDFGEMAGNYDVATSNETLSHDSDLLRFDNGEKAKVDGSGFQFTVGLSYTLGGKR